MLSRDMYTGEYIQSLHERTGNDPALLKPKSFSYLRIVDPVAYGYVVEAGKLLQGTEFIE